MRPEIDARNDATRRRPPPAAGRPQFEQVFRYGSSGMYRVHSALVRPRPTVWQADRAGSARNSFSLRWSHSVTVAVRREYEELTTARVRPSDRNSTVSTAPARPLVRVASRIG